MTLVVIHFVVVCRRQQTPPLTATSVINLPRFVGDECIAHAQHTMGPYFGPESWFLPTPPAFDAPIKGSPSEYRHKETRSSAVAEAARCFVSVSSYSFNIRTAQFFYY